MKIRKVGSLDGRNFKISIKENIDKEGDSFPTFQMQSDNFKIELKMLMSDFAKMSNFLKKSFYLMNEKDGITKEEVDSSYKECK